MSELHLKYKFWIESDENISILGEGKWILLKTIRATGSLKAAVDQMGYAYRQTWDNLRKIETRLGFRLIEKTRGGAKGGQTVLTVKGEKLVDMYEQLYQQIDPIIQQRVSHFEDELNSFMKQQ
jgi:molybdate transport system regulatory protein